MISLFDLIGFLNVVNIVFFLCENIGDKFKRELVINCVDYFIYEFVCIIVNLVIVNIDFFWYVFYLFLERIFEIDGERFLSVYLKKKL